MQIFPFLQEWIDEVFKRGSNQSALWHSGQTI